MRRTRAPDNVGVKPAKSDSASGGYYDDGPPATVFSADDANMFQEELVAIAGLKGVALDTTGANDHQCADALAGVKAIEAHNVEATAIDSYFSMAVIASDDAEVGEDDNGAEHCAVIAGQLSAAKGFESVAAGVYKMKAAGDQSAVIASKCSSGSAGHASVTGAQSVAIGVLYTSLGDKVTGDYAGAFGGQNNTVAGDAGAVLGGSAHTVDGYGSVVVGGTGHAINGSARALIAGGTTHTLTGDDAAMVGGYLNTISESGHGANQSAIVGGNLNTIDDAQDAFIAGGDHNRIGTSSDGSAIIGSQYARVDSKANCVVLGSRHIDTDLTGSDAANYSVCGGYDASTDVKPSWALQSNGGVIYATNTTVQGVDYAELIPNKDGVPHAPGRLLTFDGRGVRLAAAGEECEGVVSVHPTVLGGSDDLGWHGAYERDRWGAFVYEEAEEVSQGRAPDHGEAAARVTAARSEHRSASRAAAHALARAERECTIARQAQASAVADVARLETEAAEREVHAAVQAQALADAGALRKILRGSTLERLAARAAESAAHARALADAAVETADALRVRVESAEAALIDARAAVLSVPPADPDLSDLDMEPAEIRRKVRQRKLSPAWDRDRARTHTPRSKRPEQWTAMGVLGQMRVAVDGTVRAGSYVVPSDKPGIGTHSDVRGEGIRIKVLEIESPFDEAEGCAVAYCWVGR